MIFWITIKVYEFLFNATVTGDAAGLAKVASFFELLVEVTLIVMLLIGISIAIMKGGNNE